MSSYAMKLCKTYSCINQVRPDGGDYCIKCQGAISNYEKRATLCETNHAELPQSDSQTSVLNISAPEDFTSPFTSQVGGNHYSKLAIQPIEYIYKNNIPFPEGSVIKYVTRWRDKGGIKDLEKAKHFIELLIELENGNVRKTD